MDRMGGGREAPEGGEVCIRITESLTQHCKATIAQFKKNSKWGTQGVGVHNSSFLYLL